MKITLKICEETEKQLRNGGLAFCPRGPNGRGKKGRGDPETSGWRRIGPRGINKTESIKSQTGARLEGVKGPGQATGGARATEAHGPQRHTALGDARAGGQGP